MYTGSFDWLFIAPESYSVKDDGFRSSEKIIQDQTAKSSHQFSGSE